jgi:hypothetical protein
MVNQKTQTVGELFRDVVLLSNYTSDWICIDHALRLHHSAGIFVDERRLMAIFGRPNKLTKSPLWPTTYSKGKRE